MDGAAMKSVTITARKNSNGLYPVEARKECVRQFLSSQPISRKAFALQQGIGRKTFARWLAAYGPALGAVTCSDTHKSNSQAVAVAVPVPYAEYLELQEIKAKYSAICAMCR